MNKRILIIGSFRSGALGESFAAGFEQLGLEVLRFDCEAAYLRTSKFSRNHWLRRMFRRALWDRMNLTTREMSECLRPRLIFAVKAAYLDPETIHDLRNSLKVPFINYYPDNPYCGVPIDPTKTSAQRRDLLEVLKEYSHLWIWSPQMADRLRQDGVCAEYMPFAADLAVYSPYCGEALRCTECSGDHGIVFVGQHNRKRGAHVHSVHRHSISLWGARWSCTSPGLCRQHRIHAAEAFGPGAARLYSLAYVSLNILDDLNIPGHNMRTFEIPASGGVLLSSYTDEQAAFFAEGEAATYYRSPDELDDKIERLLRDMPLRERIRRNAIRIASQHTYRQRAETILRASDVRY